MVLQDNMASYYSGAGPYTSGAAVSPDNSNDLPGGTTKALWVGGTGDIQMRLADDGGDTVTVSSIPAGTLLPLRVVRVHAASTTASSIVALY